MAILVDENSLLIIQGITGREGSFYTKHMIDYGTKILGGVTPGKGGEWVHGKPVFDSVKKAVDATGANTSVIYVPAASAIDAIYEAIEADIKLIVCITEGIPVLDMIRIRAYVKQSNSRLIGPNCPGLLTPNVTNVGMIPGYIAQPGNLGVVSRSGTLAYDIVYTLTQSGIGQTTCVGIGNDPIIGTDFLDILQMFEEDAETERILLVGEIGGHYEIDAAEYIKAYMTKPVVAFIAGRTAPTYTASIHSGQLLEKVNVTDKMDALFAAGVRVADYPEQIADLLQNAT